MTRKLLLGVAFLVLALCSLPAVAAPPDPAMEAALAAIFAPAPETGTPPAAQEVAKRPSVTPKSTTIVHCWDGSTRTCYGASSSGADSNCPGQRGYCTGTSTGTLYCPGCPCSATTTCPPNGTTLYCEGSSYCAVEENCYIQCGSTFYECPYQAPKCRI